MAYPYPSRLWQWGVKRRARRTSPQGVLLWYFSFDLGVLFSYSAIMHHSYIVFWRNVRVASVGYFFGIIALISSYCWVIPLILLDIILWQFQHIYFRIMEIPRLSRDKYVILDRYKLTKLTAWQKIHCFYCEYANGVIAYAKAVINQMELYSCAIKHDHHPLGQDHQKDFFEREKFE